MGKLLRATRRMVNETFGTNFGRVRNVKKAWEMAQEENAEHTRQQEKRRLAELAIDGPRIAELKDGSGLPETKVGSPEFVTKMVTSASEYMSKKKGDASTEKWLPAMYDLPSLAEEMIVKQVSRYGDFIARGLNGGPIIGMVEERSVGGTDRDARRVRTSTAYDSTTGLIKEVELTNHLRREKDGRGYTGDYEVTKTDGAIRWISPDGIVEYVAIDKNGVRQPGTLYRRDVGELAYLRRLEHMMEHFDSKLEKSSSSVSVE
jgi:hypothetical protein